MIMLRKLIIRDINSKLSWESMRIYAQGIGLTSFNM